MKGTVVSRLRTRPVWVGIFFVAAAGAYVLLADLRGGGISQTLLFESTGILAYPIFYGCVLAGIALQFRMFAAKDEWLTVTTDAIKVGTRQVPISEVCGVEIRRNWIGLRELVLRRNGGRDFATKVYLLDRPASAVADELRARLTQRSAA
jgi:hypothetical protein